VPPADVGALTWCPGTSLAKLELLPAWLDCMFNMLVVEPLLLGSEYGLLVARLLPMPAREVDDDIRCRL
jgi:hypothetical protein